MYKWCDVNFNSSLFECTAKYNHDTVNLPNVISAFVLLIDTQELEAKEDVGLEQERKQESGISNKKGHHAQCHSTSDRCYLFP